MLVDPAVVYANAARKRCLRVAEAIVNEIVIEPETPVRTGRLEHGYHARDDGGGAVVATNTPYWQDVEFGTRHTRAKPHVRPAIETVRARGVP